MKSSPVSFFENHQKVIANQSLVILLVNIAKQRGVHHDKLLKGTKLFYHHLSEQNFAISHQQFVVLVNNAIKQIKGCDIAFLLGSQLLPNHLGAIGKVINNCRNFQDVIRVVKCHHQAIFPYMFLREIGCAQKSYFLFNHAVSHENSQYQQFICELLLSMLASLIKWRFADEPRNTVNIQIRLPYQKPTQIECYHAYLPSQLAIVFEEKNQGWGALQICCNRDDLTMAFSESHSLLKYQYLKGAKRLCNGNSVGLVQCVSNFIASCLRENRDYSLEATAQFLGISSATLKRKLTAHNTSYQALLDLYRKQQAVFQLTEQAKSNDDVAQSLMFTDITNFRRSFKRWTGLTPSALRNAYAKQ